MSRGEFMKGAPHGVGYLILKDFNGTYLIAENKREARSMKRGPTNTDNIGGGFRETYDKANEKEFQTGPDNRAR